MQSRVVQGKRKGKDLPLRGNFRGLVEEKTMLEFWYQKYSKHDIHFTSPKFGTRHAIVVHW